MREYHTEAGVLSLWQDGVQGPSFAPGTPRDEIDAAAESFFGPDLTLPGEPIPRDRVMMFLTATNRKAQVRSFLQSRFGDIAAEEFDSFRDFDPTSALGRATQVALGLNDADYAQACRDMAQFGVDDYGDPKPTLLGQISKFLFGG